MPFIRQTRDKRGFEHTYVMHVSRPASGPPRTRVLYVFRSPGNLKVGRKALDAEVMEALEHTHPDLSFDWGALTREAVVTRAEPAPRPAKGQRPRPSGPPTAGAPRAAVVPEAPLPEDFSLLGRTVGAAEAARLRRRYSELVQRVGRRARTPEERQRLLDRAGRLNPDAWVDEPAVRGQVSTVDAEFDAIAAELPSRRRGRRGGRRRPEEGPPEASGIMAGGGAAHEEFDNPRVDDQDRTPDSGGEPGVGPAAADVPGDD